MKDMFRNAMLPAGMAGLMLAPAVVAFRLPLLAAEAGNGDPWRTETVRAVAEKASAMMEGGLAAQMVLVTSCWRFWPEAFSGKVPSLLNGRTARMAAEAAMKPAARRVKANFRRLSAKG